jgi:hypothetical protein
MAISTCLPLGAVTLTLTRPPVSSTTWSDVSASLISTCPADQRRGVPAAISLRCPSALSRQFMAPSQNSVLLCVLRGHAVL